MKKNGLLYLISKIYTPSLIAFRSLPTEFQGFATPSRLILYSDVFINDVFSKVEKAKEQGLRWKMYGKKISSSGYLKRKEQLLAVSLWQSFANSPLLFCEQYMTFFYTSRSHLIVLFLREGSQWG